jgi:hypothetical protein
LSKPVAKKSRKEDINPEAELLLACASTQIDAARTERIRALLHKHLDWLSLMHLALRHGLLPLLYRNLCTTDPELVPHPVLCQLRTLFLANAQRNLLLTIELLKLLELFGAHGIPVIPFKGPTLAASAYGDLSLRQFADLDILIRQRDIPTALTLLTSQGYQLRAPQARAHDMVDLPKYHILVSKDERVRMDLQWCIAGPSFSFPVDVEQLLDHLDPLSLAGTIVFHLSLREQLLILCVHGSKHHWERLKWICDVAEVIRAHQGEDCEQFFEYAGKVGARRMLSLGLFLANDLLGAALPDSVLRRIQADPALPPLAAQVRAQLFANADQSTSPTARAVFYFRVKERFRDRVRYCLHYTWRYFCIAITPNADDHALLPLPTYFFPLYYLLRPIRMIRTYLLHPRKLKSVLSEWFESID